jgi:hypothetical protein
MSESETIEEKVCRYLRVLFPVSPEKDTPDKKRLGNRLIQDICKLVELAIAEEREASAIVGGHEAEKCLNFPDGQRVADAIRQRAAPKAEVSE